MQDETPLYYGEKISENMVKTPEGYLVCLNVTIASSAPMEYNNSEVGFNTDKDVVIITNPWEELSNLNTVASFQGKPVTFLHPEEWLGANNAVNNTVGTCINVRADEKTQTLVADLVIIAEDAINAIIKDGIKEVSCGYTAERIDNGDGTGTRTGIIGNHVAIVPAGRCGDVCSIKDSRGKKMDKKTIFEKIKALVVDAEEPATQAAEPFDAKKAIEDLTKLVADLEAKLATKDTEPTTVPNGDKIDQVLALLQKLIDAETAGDNGGTEDKGTPKATDSVTITVPKVTDGVNTPMTPAMLNAMAAQFYKKG
jgi:hypothetical protein